MHKRLILISVLNLSLFFGLAVVMGQSETPQPTEELPSLVPLPTGLITPPEYFPEYLICDETKVDNGSHWFDIEIGVSSLDDLMTTLERFGDYIVWLDEDNYLYLGRVEDEDEQLEVDPLIAPSFVAVCISDEDTIVTLGILSRRGLELDIYDLTAIYGIPDAVTWIARPMSRIAFWFDEGVATTIDIIEDTQIPYRITAIYYYPFVDETTYENEYPFAYTRQDALSSIERNPFDFDSIVATITAQPSQTTPTPHSTELIATATPD